MTNSKREGPPLPPKGIDRWYHEAWKFKGQLKEPSWFALANLERYLNGLVIQWNRILEDWDLIAPRLGKLEEYVDNIEPLTTLQETGTSYWLDAHFYLTSWDNVRKNFEVLVKREPIPEIGLAWRGVKVMLRDASRARDFHEHSSEWESQYYSVSVGGIDGRTGRDDGLFVLYPPKRGIKKLGARWVQLGRPEVLKVADAYEMVLKALASRKSSTGSPNPTSLD
jgi:hypothetical protein